ncbi:MaoC/PaaZ C-terminal domain-containing protein [Salinarimonas ramus]|uniref:MaoC-like domain-containing protein n=1 Tax=Salinarimonas ramus TaxID=690164 RepID=A0A917V2S6_9HYPH|nr:MaoC/PaaZ C-terminal domain-containing protein [Salinarimonas ramus]GGK25626.1 hypothetical protein GCM10011322_10210 [Salinarimonas ramus]
MTDGFAEPGAPVHRLPHAEDYVTGAVHSLGAHRVTAEEIVSFARSYDPQPYHLDAQAGAASFFGGLVASGWHTGAIWMGLYVRAMLEGAKVEGSPGLESLRWHAPVRPGDVLHGRCEVGEIVPNPFRKDLVTVKKLGSLLREGETKPVMTLVLLARMLRRPASTDPTR